MSVRNAGFTLTEGLISVGIGSIIMLVLITSTVNTKSLLAESEAREEYFLLRTKMLQSLETNTKCGKLLQTAPTLPGQFLDPTLDTTTRVNLYQVDDVAGTAVWMPGSAVSANGSRWGSYWRVLGVTLTPTGVGSSNRQGTQVRRATLSLELQKSGSAQTFMDSYELALVLNMTNPARIMDCYRAFRTDDGMETVPTCAPNEKARFFAIGTEEPKWHCEAK